MILKTKFEPLQRVRIIALENYPARITNIIVRPGKIIWYVVEYYWDGRIIASEMLEGDLIAVEQAAQA